MSPKMQEQILKKSKEEMESRIQKMREEQCTLLKTIAVLNEKNEEWSGDELSKKFKLKMNKNREYYETFNKSIIGGMTQVPYPVITNKMLKILADTEKLLGSDNNALSQIMSGKIPTEYAKLDFGSKEIPVIKNTAAGYYWGTYRPTLVSYLAYESYFLLSGKNIAHIPLDVSISHVAPLPEGISLDPECSFSYDKNEIRGFGFPHSGYAYGGSRNQTVLYPTGKRFCPEDCSSWVAKMTLYPEEPFSTKEQFLSYFNPNHPLKTRFEPIKKLENVSPGDVVALYSKDSEKDWNTQEGHSGHTGIVESINQGEMRILNYNRKTGDDEKKEGPRVEGPHVRVYSLDRPDDKGFYTLSDSQPHTSRLLFFSVKPEEKAETHATPKESKKTEKSTHP